MPHKVDGFGLSFTYRGSWKAERTLLGEHVDIVPVTWTKGRRQIGGEVFQEVWFKAPEEIAEYSLRPDPFVVAVAVAKDYNKMPHEFSDFVALFSVVATGAILSDVSIETRVVRRITSREP